MVLQRLAVFYYTTIIKLRMRKHAHTEHAQIGGNSYIHSLLLLIT